MTKGRKVAVGLALAIVACVALARFDPLGSHWPFHCPFKLLTGLQCPGCGSQRALHALLAGRVGEAVGYNLFLVFAVPYLLLLIMGHLLPEGQTKTVALRWLEHRCAVGFYIVSFSVWKEERKIPNI